MVLRLSLSIGLRVELLLRVLSLDCFSVEGRGNSESLDLELVLVY